MPSAWLAYLSFGVTALSGIAYLWRRDLRFDAVALAGAEIGVMFTAFAIWGGMMWGRPVWGVFWQWEDPRLTTTALLLALYLGYLLIRRLTEDPYRRATRAAVVGIVAAIDIPIVHFSVEWWRGLHQDRHHRLTRQGPPPIGAWPVRDRAGRHGGGLHHRLELAHGPPLPAGQDRVADRGARAARPHQRRPARGPGAATRGEPVAGPGVEGA